MLIQISLSSLIVPKCQDLARSFLRTSTINFFENFIKAQKFNDTIKGVTIFSDRKDDDGNMYFVDSRQGKMVSLDTNGEFRFVTGQKGRGPGDLENVYSMAYHDGMIYLTNLSGARIDAFDTEGNFTSSTTLSKNIVFGSIKGITEESEFILRSVVWGELADDIS